MYHHKRKQPGETQHTRLSPQSQLPVHQANPTVTAPLPPGSDEGVMSPGCVSLQCAPHMGSRKGSDSPTLTYRPRKVSLGCKEMAQQAGPLLELSAEYV